MPADASIFDSYTKPPKSVIDYQNEYAKADQLRNQNAIQSLTLQQQTAATAQSLAERNALQRIAASSGGDRQAMIAGMRNSGLPGLMTQADSLEQSGAKLQESQATAAEKTAAAGKTTQETQIAGHAQHLQALSTVNSPQDAMQWITEGVRSGALPSDGLPAALDRLQQASATPEGFAQWKQQTQQAGMTVQQQMELTTPKPTEVRLGNVVKTIDMNPRSASFGKEVVGQQQVGVSPDTVANNTTSRANNADTLKKDYAVAGLNTDGSNSGANDSMVDAIGQYKVAPPSGMALRNPRMQQILAQVTQKYPDFDSTQYGARQVAAKSFSTGKDGQSVQSANTALNHLATLKELAAAQDNGDIRLFNTIANRFATETGGAAPTNLASAVTMVGPEISKAVIGVGGGQGDREKVDSALASLTKGGKGQAAGTIATMQDLFGGRLTEAQRTYQRTTGRNDFPGTFLSPAAQAVLAARTGAQPGASAVPPDIAAILAKHGGK